MANGAMTRLQLGEATGLSAPTTSHLVARLEELGLLREAGWVAGKKGPNAVVYQLSTDAMRGVAVDVQPRRLMAQMVDATPAVYPVTEVARTGGRRRAEDDLSAAIEAACAAANHPRTAVVAVCVGLPGAVSQTGDQISLADSSVAGWPKIHARSELEERLGLTVLIDNDVKLAAVAEGAARPGEGDFALLWEGQGVGLAWLADGRVRHGQAGGAGEIGYLPLPGTLGQAAGATNVQEWVGSNGVTALVQAVRPTTRTFGAALKSLNDPELRPALLAELAWRTAEVAQPVLAVLDPAELVLAGPTGAALADDGAALVQQHLHRATQWRTPVVSAKVTEQPVLRGAALTLSHYLADQTLALVS